MDLPILHLRTTMMGNSTRKSKNQMKIALSSAQMKYVAWLETEREACCQASKPVQKVSFSATRNHPNKRGQQQFDTSKQTYCYTMVTMDERIDRTKKACRNPEQNADILTKRIQTPMTCSRNGTNNDSRGSELTRESCRPAMNLDIASKANWQKEDIYPN